MKKLIFILLSMSVGLCALEKSGGRSLFLRNGEGKDVLKILQVTFEQEKDVERLNEINNSTLYDSQSKQKKEELRNAMPYMRTFLHYYDTTLEKKVSLCTYYADKKKIEYVLSQDISEEELKRVNQIFPDLKFDVIEIEGELNPHGILMQEDSENFELDSEDEASFVEVESEEEQEKDGVPSHGDLKQNKKKQLPCCVAL